MKIVPLRIAIELPRLELEIRQPRVHIDDREARADIGLKPIGQVARELAALGHSTALQAVAQIAREGDRLAQIELPGNPIPELAQQRGLRDAQLNVDSMPKHRVKVDLERGKVSFRFDPGRVHVSGSIHLAAGRFIEVIV